MLTIDSNLFPDNNITSFPTDSIQGHHITARHRLVMVPACPTKNSPTESCEVLEVDFLQAEWCALNRRAPAIYRRGEQHDSKR
jgi:hypothetical protein